jgi:ATP-binding cassette subfamily B protein
MWNNSSNLVKRAEEAFVHQQDQFDCGVACLLSVINYLGGESKLERLRELSGTSKQGTKLLGLYQAAAEVGLEAEAYKANIENLKKQTDPCILHILKECCLQHYVIFYGMEGGKFIISDPAEGVKQLTADELREVWESKALLLLKPTPTFITVKEKKEDRWRWIKQLVREDITILGLALALGIFVSILSLATAIFSQKLIDEILPAEDTTKLLVGLGLLGVLLVAKNGFFYIRQLFLVRQSRDFNNRIINSFYSSLLKLPVPFFFNRKTGDLIARMNDTRRLQKTITYLFSEIMIDILLVLTAGIFIMTYSVYLGLFVWLSVPLFFLLTWRYNDAILQGQKKVMAAHSTNESNYVDTIQGIATIKTGNRESFFSMVTKNVYGFFQDQIFDLGKVGISFSFWANMISTFFMIGVLGLASMLVLQEQILLGALVAIFQMTSQLIPSANRLALTNIRLQEAKVAFERMYEFTSLKPEYSDESDKGETIEAIKKLSVSELSFRFPGRSQLLKNVSFSVEQGEMIALLGESGCGKTTMLQILQRFYEPESGTIFVNGNSKLREIRVQDWRNHIASVPQQIKIFNGTLLDNICLGDVQEEAEQVVQFCKEYGFHDFFKDFPQQYATILGEEGANISGGQQQLVALARALYQEPDLLLLDEATSAMDRETEQKMLDLICSLKDKMSIILVTHRVQSTKWADNIYILEGGVVSQYGTPSELASGENLFAMSLTDLSLSTS